MDTFDTSRAAVIERLGRLPAGSNLHELALVYGVTVHRAGKLNKGWAGQTLEKIAGLDAGSARRRDGSDFELKSTTLLPTSSGWKPKETIKITAMNPARLLEESFESSALWEKLSSLVVVGLHHPAPDRCEIVKVSAFDVTDPDLVGEIRSYWEEVRVTLSLGEIADHHSSVATSDGLLQLRPTGNGKAWSTCPVTGVRFGALAFYATKRLVSRVLGI